MANLQFANDENGNRIKPSPRGRGFCPICEGPMIAKCGEIYRWHWQHDRERNCDSWKEHETAWHRAWKEIFPESWREIIIERNGEKHIADVLTKYDTVIEFQNSPISVNTILVRESFYKNMLWVINAKSFSTNFSIRSKVSQKLMRLEESYKHDLKNFYSLESRDPVYNKKIFDLERDKESYKRIQEQEEQKLKDLTQSLESLNDIVSKTIISWEKEIYQNFSIFGMSEISERHKSDFKDKTIKINLIKSQVTLLERNLNEIENMNTYQYLGIKYVLVNYERLNVDMIERSIIILKSNMDTIFPTILKFQNKLDFLTYKYKADKYLFAVDTTKTIEKITGDITRLNSEYHELQIKFPDYHNCLSLDFEKFIQNELKSNEKRFYEASENEMKVQTEIFTLEIEKNESDAELETFYSKQKEEEKLEYEKEKGRIMRTYKGQYTFLWKRERKSWSETTCPVYFDIGEDYLFERTGPNSLTKISIETFMERYLNV